MMTVPQAFELALQHHRAGRLAEAETVYRQILAVQPGHAGALHLLGVICHQVGRDDLAIDLIRRAIAFNPNNSSAHSNLGEAYRTSGRFEEAIASYRTALQLQPNNPDALYNLGNTFQGQGRHEEAMASYRHALHFRPDYVEASVNLGAVLFDLKKFDEAVAAYQEALRLKPDLPETYNNLCDALVQLERFDEALAAIRRALELKPDYAEAYNNLGTILARNRHLEEAITAYRRAVEYKPGYAKAQCNLGNALRENGQTDEAIAACRRALELDPLSPEAHNNLASALVEKGRLDEAEAGFHRSLELRPGFDDAKVNYAMLLLLRGDFERGWPWYEARSRLRPSTVREFAQPKWDGSAVQGGRVLVHAEQGFGDAIQFIRYAPLIAGRGGEVIVECRQPLVELFRSVRGVREVVMTDDPLPPFDWHVPMLSQPMIFQTRRETVPREVPYLFAETGRCEAWRIRLGDDRTRLRVGLSWAGSPLNRRNRTRNVSLEMLRPLWLVGRVDFFSLQVGHGPAETWLGAEKASIIEHTEHIHDFADTAALMSQLDLIITVDTAAAHLAGALGRPVWTLLPFIPDWRWGLEGEDTPWYPTMKLFRQPTPGDWNSVIQHVAAELEQTELRRKGR